MFKAEQDVSSEGACPKQGVHLARRYDVGFA